jgi:transcriptional regulator with XRE-family HTH domain
MKIHTELKRIKTMLLGNKIKELREEHGVLQRQLTALLEIDTPMFSKIERGNRYAKRTQVIQLAEYFKIDKNELLTLWLADKILDVVENENELKLAAMAIAQSEMMI